MPLWEACILHKEFHQALVLISHSVITLERLLNLLRSRFSRAVCGYLFIFQIQYIHLV